MALASGGTLTINGQSFGVASFELKVAPGWEGTPPEIPDVWDLDLTDPQAMADHARAVAANGLDKTECPVGPGGECWDAWQRSWGSERSYMERSSGAMGYRTNLMKAEVRRQMEHLPEHQADPCAEVTRRPASEVFAVIGRSAIAVLKDFEKAAEQVATALSKSSQEIKGLQASMTVIDEAMWNRCVTPSEDDSTRRLRHGNAADCPRHGPTRGGTCLKCARRRR